MIKIKAGDKVVLHYNARFKDGELYESTRDRDPELFDLADGKTIDGIRKHLIGMEVGEKKTFIVTPEEAFGDHDDNLTIEVDRGQFPETVKPFVGQKLLMEREDGGEVTVIITHISDEAVTIDANHPLAGKTLEFEVEVIGIK